MATFDKSISKGDMANTDRNSRRSFHQGNVSEGSSFVRGVLEPQRLGKQQLDDDAVLTCQIPFDQLFSKQRSYFQNGDNQALQEFHLKQPSNMSDSEIEVISQMNLDMKNLNSNQESQILNNQSPIDVLDDSSPTRESPTKKNEEIGSYGKFIVNERPILRLEASGLKRELSLIKRDSSSPLRKEYSSNTRKEGSPMRKDGSPFRKDLSPSRRDTSPHRSDKFRLTLKNVNDNSMDILNKTRGDGNLAMISIDQDDFRSYSPGGQNEPDVLVGKLGSATQNAEQLNGSQQDFLKAVKGVGNIFRFLGIIQPKMKRFFYTKTMSGRMRSMTIQVRKTINDLADYEAISEIKSSLHILINSILYGLSRLYTFLRIDKIPIINPENIWKVTFNCILVTYNCFYLFLRSLEIFFEAELAPYSHYFHYIAEAAWVLEMVVQMNTSMYHRNHFTKDRKIIMKIYLEEYFFFEILPLIFDGRTSEYLLLSILFKLPLLLKFKGMMIILKNVEFYILQILENHVFFFLIKLILQMILFAHTLACAFSTILVYQDTFLSANTAWEELYLESKEEWYKRYLHSLYWAFATMMNVHNVQPSSNIELFFTCLCMLISCVAFGYLLSSIGSILSEINKQHKDYKQDLNILNQFMKRKKIEIGLVRRANIQLKKYYEQQRRVRYQEENATLMKLNEYMMKELLISSNYKVLKRYPFFFNLFTTQTLMKICVKMQEKFYSPSQIIFDNSIPELQNDYYLYLIIDGNIQIEDQFNLLANQEKKADNKYIFLNDDLNKQDTTAQDFQLDDTSNTEYLTGHQERTKKIVGRKLSKGDYFGWNGFFTGRENMLKAVSQDFSSVLLLSKSDLDKILQEEKKDFEIIKEISDKMVFNEDYSDLKPLCHSCSSRYHDTYQCPKVYYDKDKLYTIYRQNFSFFMERKPIVRSKYKIFCPLVEAAVLHEVVYNIRFDYGLDQATDLDDFHSESDDQDSLVENEDQVEPLREPTKSKTMAFKDDNKWTHSDSVLGNNNNNNEEHKLINVEPHRVESRFESMLHESNLHMNIQGLIDDDPGDVGAGGKLKGVGLEGNLMTPNLGNLPHVSNFESQGNPTGNLTNVPQSLRKGSIDNTLYGITRNANGNNMNNNASNNVNRQEQILRQLVENVQNVLATLNFQKNITSSPAMVAVNNMNNGLTSNTPTNINTNSNNNNNTNSNNINMLNANLNGNSINTNSRRRTSNLLVGSALEMSTRLAQNNNNNSFYQKSSYQERRNTGLQNFPEEMTAPLSRKSILRQPLRQNSMVSRQQTIRYTSQMDTLRDMTSKSKGQLIFQQGDMNSQALAQQEMDKLQNYELYFPQYNAPEVIARCNNYIQRNIKKWKIKRSKMQSQRKSIRGERKQDSKSQKTVVLVNQQVAGIAGGGAVSVSSQRHQQSLQIPQSPHTQPAEGYTPTLN